MTGAREYDLVLLGATGVSGRLAASRVAARISGEFRWALAGRDSDRLESLRQSLRSAHPKADAATEIVDIRDPARMRKLCSRTRVIVNTVGPYLNNGLQVVGACIDAGTDYCDLAGELPFIRRSIDAYDGAAKRSGARIVHACGYDSVPSDLGLIWLQHELVARGYEPARAITTYVCSLRGTISGGSAASLLVLGEVANEEYARAMAPRGLNPGEESGMPTEADATGPELDEEMGIWTAPFFMIPINTRVVRRSLALSGQPWGRDFVYREKMVGGRGVRGRLTAAMYYREMALLMGLTRRRWGRSVLKRLLPRPGRGPSEKTRRNGEFRHLVVPTLADGSHPILARVEGEQDPGYGETSRMLAECALALALDGVRAAGGVITPAVAFGLPLVKRLQDAGMTWRIEPGSGANTIRRVTQKSAGQRPEMRA